MRVAGGAQALLEPRQIAVHDRLQICVEHGRREALELHDTRRRHRRSTTRAVSGSAPSRDRRPRARGPDSDTRAEDRPRAPRRPRPRRRRARARRWPDRARTSTAPSAARRSTISNRCLRSTTGLGRTNVGTKSAGILRLVRPISIRSRKPAVVRIATRAPRRSSTALVPDGRAVDEPAHVAARDAERLEGRPGPRPLRYEAVKGPW